MDIQSLLNTPKSTAASTRKSDISALNQEDFMKLMLQQLKSQDPFKPTDNTQFIAQMAQLSTVSGIGEMKNSLNDVVDSLRGSQMLTASNLLGREVMVQTDKVTIDGSNPDLLGQIDIDTAAQSVDIEIRNSAGAVVKRLHADDQAAGPLLFAWDGKDDSGAAVAAGSYQLVASANVSGKSQALTTKVRAPVTGVSLPTDGQGPQLQVRGLGTLKLTDIKEVG